MRGTARGAKRGAAVLLTAMAMTVAGEQSAAAASKEKTPVFDWQTGSAITGAFSQMERSASGIATTMRTQADAGHAYTLWYAIFNAPSACSGGMCGEDDIFDGEPGDPFNRAQVSAARISVVWAGAGDVANAAGRLKLDGALEEGDVPDGGNQVVIGLASDGSVVPQGLTSAAVTGLEDAMAAEVHLVVLDHGPAFEDPDDLEGQLTEFGHPVFNPSGCNFPGHVCVDAQFALHRP